MRRKDGESLTLVIDARVPNALHSRPPKSRLATAAPISDLKWSEEAAAFEGDLDALEFGVRCAAADDKRPFSVKS